MDHDSPRLTDDMFVVNIDYKPGTDAPSRVFRAMSDMVTAIEKADRILVQSFAANVSPVLLLEDIERGSVRAWFRNALKDIPDDVLAGGEVKRIVGHYLVKTKRAIINWEDRHATIEGRAEVIELQDEIRGIAEETNLLPIPAYGAPSAAELVEVARDFKNAAAVLVGEEKMRYETAEGTVEVSKTFEVAPERLEELVTRETYRNSVEMLLVVKKPDFLGNSQWELRHGKRSVPTSIEDEEWLADFHDRKISLMPGDAMRAFVRVEAAYGYDNELVSERYVVERVIEIVRPAG